jgi:hypothetical protein
MKYCPVCDARYDEEVIQFCTKDGTPLVEEDEPRFTALPSEDSEDIGEETVIRRRGDAPVTTETSRSEPIVIPTSESVRREPVRSRPQQTYYAPPPQNTGKVITLTILGTIAAIGFGALLFWALTRNNQPTNLNINTQMPNMNANGNANGFDSNFNFNSNSQFPQVNLPIPNINVNANVKTPTPSPTPKPSVTPTASPVPTETPERTPRPTPSGTPRPTITPTPRTGPRPPGNLGEEN